MGRKNIIRTLSVWIFAAVLHATGFPGHASAQSLNPTVEVTRRFETSLKEIHKSPLELSALDSLMSGTLDFDYSVFDRGLGEGRKFIPNAFGAVNLPSGKKEPVFLFDAGLGTGAAFPFLSHAAMDLALPIGKNFSLAVYGSHRGYFGNLSQLSFDTGVSERTGAEYNDVIDMGNSAGISGKYSWKTGTFRFGVDYSGIMSRQSAARRDFNSLSGTIGVSSHRTDADYFYYRADVGYSYSDDRYSYPGNAVSGIIENRADALISIGPVFRRHHGVIADIGLRFAAYSGYRDLTVAAVDFVPRYHYSKGRWNIAAGVRFSVCFTDAAASAAMPDGTNGTNWIFPSADVSFMAVKDYLWLGVAADGGNGLNRHSELVEKYPFLAPGGIYGSFQNFTVTPYRLSFKLSGRVRSWLSYEAHVRYGRQRGMAAFAMADALTPYMSYTLSSDFFNAGTSLSFSSKSVKVEAGFEYDNYFNVRGNGNELLPPAVRGNGAVEYNWRQRIFISVGAVFSGKWGVSPYVIPAWVDLHAEIEYRFNEKFSVFVSGGNLLNDTIQYQPLQAVAGINFMAGIGLKL